MISLLLPGGNRYTSAFDTPGLLHTKILFDVLAFWVWIVLLCWIVQKYICSTLSCIVWVWFIPLCSTSNVPCKLIWFDYNVRVKKYHIIKMELDWLMYCVCVVIVSRLLDLWTTNDIKGISNTLSLMVIKILF